MCLSIPARVDSIEDGIANCTVGKSSYRTSLDLIQDEEIKPGDYVLIHTGFAIQKIDTDEANRILSTFDEFRELNEQMDKEEQEQNTRLI